MSVQARTKEVQSQHWMWITYYWELLSNSTTSQSFTTNWNSRQTFIQLLSRLTLEHFGRQKYKGLSNLKANINHLKAFLQVGQKLKQYKGTVSVIDSLYKLKKMGWLIGVSAKRNWLIQHKLFHKYPTFVVNKASIDI